MKPWQRFTLAVLGIVLVGVIATSCMAAMTAGTQEETKQMKACVEAGGTWSPDALEECQIIPRSGQ